MASTVNTLNDTIRTTTIGPAPDRHPSVEPGSGPDRGRATSRRPGRRLGRIVGALALGAATMLSVPALSGPAQASPTSLTVLSHGFETPSTVWAFTQSGSGFGFVDNAPVEAHTGSRSALLGMFGPGFSSVGRNVNLLSTATTCTASAFIAPRFAATRQINFEVIDPSTFRYIALKSIQVNGAGPYQFHAVSWPKGRNNVLLRFSLIGSDSGATTRARVDDVRVTCN